MIQKPCSSGAVALLAILLACGLSACTAANSDGNTSVPDGPYKALILQAKDRVTTEFQKEVLSDGEITRAEYDEAVHRYVKCYADQDIVVQAHINSGGYYQYGVSSPKSVQFQADTNQCWAKNLDGVEDIYIQMLTNPAGIDIVDAEVACLRKGGLVDESFTGEQLKKLLAEDPTGGNLPYDHQDPVARRCNLNPASG